ncbi:hypothetical protein Vafri_8072, partial [Volvox africanus]
TITTASGVHRTRSPEKSTQTDPAELGMMTKYQKHQQVSAGPHVGKSTGATSAVANAAASQMDDTGDAIDRGRPHGPQEPNARQHAAAAATDTGKAHADAKPGPSSSVECQDQRDQNPLGGTDNDQHRQCDSEGSSRRIRMAEMVRRFRQEPVVVAIGEEEEDDGDAADPAGGSASGRANGSAAERSPDGATEGGEEHPVDYLAAAVLQRSRAMLRERDAIQQRIEAALSKFGVGLGVGGAGPHQTQRSPPMVAPVSAPAPWQDRPRALPPDLDPDGGPPSRLATGWGIDGGVDGRLGSKGRGALDRIKGRDDEVSGSGSWSGSIGVATQLGVGRDTGGGHGGSRLHAREISEGDSRGADVTGMDMACAAMSMPLRQQLPDGGEGAGSTTESSSNGGRTAAASERDAARGDEPAAAAATTAFGGGRINHGGGQKGSISAANTEKQAPWRERLRALLAQAGVDAGPAASPSSAAAAGTADSGSSTKVASSPPAPRSAGPGSLLKRTSEISSDPLQAWRQLRLQQQQRQLNPGAIPPDYAAVGSTSALDAWAPTSVLAPPGSGLKSHGNEGQELVRRFDSTLGSHLPGGFSAARAVLADWIAQVSDAAVGRGHGTGGTNDDVNDLLAAARLRIAAGTPATAAPEPDTTLGRTNSSSVTAVAAATASTPVAPSVDELLARLAQRFGLAPGTMAELQPPSLQRPSEILGHCSTAGAPTAPKMSLSAAHTSPVLSAPAPHSAGPTVAVATVMDFANPSMRPAPVGGGALLPTSAVSSQSAEASRRADSNSTTAAVPTAAAGALSLEHGDQKSDDVWGTGRRLVEAFEEAANGPSLGAGRPAPSVAALEGPASTEREAVQLMQRPSQVMPQQHHQTHDAMQPTSPKLGFGTREDVGRDALRFISHPRAVADAAAVTASATILSDVQQHRKAASPVAVVAAVEAVGLAAALKYDAQDHTVPVAQGKAVAAAEEDEEEVQTVEGLELSSSLPSEDGDDGDALGPHSGAWPSWMAALGIPRPVNPNLLPRAFREVEEEDNDCGGGGGGGGGSGNGYGAEPDANAVVIRRAEEAQDAIEGEEEAKEEEPASGAFTHSYSGKLPQEPPRRSANTMNANTITGMAPRSAGTSGQGKDRNVHEASRSNSAVASPQTPNRRRLLVADLWTPVGSATHGPVPVQGSFTPVLGSLLDQAVGESLFADTPPSSTGKTSVQLHPHRQSQEPQGQATGATLSQQHDGGDDADSKLMHGEDAGDGAADEGTSDGDVDADEDAAQSFWPIASAEPVAALSPSRRRLGRGGRRRGNCEEDGAEGDAGDPGDLMLRIPGDLSSFTPFSSLASSGGTRIAAILQHTVTAALFGDSPAASVDVDRSFNGTPSRLSSAGGAVGMDGGGGAGLRFSAAAGGPEELGRNLASSLGRPSPLGRSAVTSAALSPADYDATGPVPKPYVRVAGGDSGHSGIPRGDARESSSSNCSSREQGFMSLQSSAITVGSEVYEEDFADPSPQSSASAISLGGIAAAASATATAAAAAAAAVSQLPPPPSLPAAAAACTGNVEVATAPNTATIAGRSAHIDGTTPLAPVQRRSEGQHSTGEVATAAAATAQTTGLHAGIHGDSAGDIRIGAIGPGSGGPLWPSGSWYAASKTAHAAAAGDLAALELSGDVLLGVSGLTADVAGDSSSSSDIEPDGSSRVASLQSADASSASLNPLLRGSAADPDDRISGRVHPGASIAATLGAAGGHDGGGGGSSAPYRGSMAATAGFGLQSANVVAAPASNEAGDSLDGRTTEPSSRGLEADRSNSTTTSAESVSTSGAPVHQMWYSLDIEELLMLGASHSAAASGGESVRSSAAAAAAAAAALAAAAAAAGMSFPEAAAAAVASGSFDIEIDPMTGESGLVFVVEDPQEVLLRSSGGGMGGVGGGSSMPMGRRVPHVVITEIGSSDEAASSASTAAAVAEADAGKAPSLNAESANTNNLTRTAPPAAGTTTGKEGSNQRSRPAAEPWVAANSFTTIDTGQRTGFQRMEDGLHGTGQAQHDEAHWCDGTSATTAPCATPTSTYSTDTHAVTFMASDPLVQLKATVLDDNDRTVISSNSNTGGVAASGDEAPTNQAAEPLSEAFVPLTGVAHIGTLQGDPSPRGSRLLPPISSSGRNVAAAGLIPIGGSPARQDILNSQSPQLLPPTHQLDASQSPLRSHPQFQPGGPDQTPSLGGEMLSGDQKPPTLQQQGQQQLTGAKAPTRRHLFANAGEDAGGETGARGSQQGWEPSREEGREKEGHLSSANNEMAVPLSARGVQTHVAAATVVAAPNMMAAAAGAAAAATSRLWDGSAGGVAQRIGADVDVSGNVSAAGTTASFPGPSPKSLQATGATQQPLAAFWPQAGSLPDTKGTEMPGLATGLGTGSQRGPGRLDGPVAGATAPGVQRWVPQPSKAQPAPLPFAVVGTGKSVDQLPRTASVFKQADVDVATQQHWEQQQPQPLQSAETAAAAVSFFPSHAISQSSSTTWTLPNAPQPTLTRPISQQPQQQQRDAKDLGDDLDAMKAAATFTSASGWRPSGYTSPLAPVPAPAPPLQPTSHLWSALPPLPFSSWAPSTAAIGATTASHGGSLGLPPSLPYHYVSPFLVAEGQQNVYSYGYSPGPQQLRELAPSQARGPSTMPGTEPDASWPLSGVEEAEDIIVTMLKRKMDACMDKLRCVRPPPA